MPRYIPPQVFSRLTSEDAGLLHELYEFDLTSGTRYWSRAKVTWRGQVYTPMVDSRDDIVQSLDPTRDGVTVRLINVDGVVRTLIAADEFLDAPVRLRLIVDGLADNTIPVYAGAATGKSCVLTAGYPKPRQRDGLWTFTYRNGTSDWLPTFQRHDGRFSTEAAFGSATGGTFTSADGYMQVVITGTYTAGDDTRTWTVRTTNNFLVFAGISENPWEIGEDTAEVTVNGLAEQLQAPVPKRNFWRLCGWLFGPVATSLGKTSPCGYVGPTTTAVGAGASTTALTVASAVNMTFARGATITIGSGAAVVIAAISGTAITLAEARSWSNGDNITFKTCRYTFGDCQDRDREFEFGGFRGVRETKGVIQKRSYVPPESHQPGAVWALGQFAEPAVDRPKRVASPVAAVDDPIPLVYGRRVITGIPIEFSNFDDNASRGWRAAFYALTGGTLQAVAIDAAWIAGKRKKHKVVTISGKEVGQHAWWYRPGGAAVNDTETNAEYDADSDAQERSQNIDYQGSTGTAYNRIAYAIFRAARGSNIWGSDDSDKEIPEAFFRLQGRKVQAYTAAGAVDGAAAMSQSPIWQILDLMTDTIDGASIPLAQINMARPKAAADYAAIMIDSVEADTVSTATATSATQAVRSTAGFKLGETVYKNGASLAVTVADVPTATSLVLSGSVTITSGDRVHQKNARFQSDIRLDERESAVKALGRILAGCRGYIIQQDGELVVDIDRAIAAERLVDGGLEVWTSATNLTNWDEDVLGTSSVNREEATIYAGTFAARLAVDGANSRCILKQTNNLDRSGWYVLSFAAKGTDASGESVYILISDATSSSYLLPGMTWGTSQPSYSAEFILSGTAWQTFFFVFQVDPHALSIAPYIEINLGPGSGLAGQNLYLDDISLIGPGACEFRDLGRSILKQRAFILSGRRDFRQGPVNQQREVNEVKVSFQGSFGGTAYPPQDDAVIVRDETHQATHIKKVHSIEAPSLATPDQAVRIGKHHLYRARTLKEGARLSVFLAGLLPLPGDLVLISHRAPAWTRRQHRVKQVAINPDWSVEAECEHYDPAVYTDAGEPSEPGIGSGLPTITLTLDKFARRRMDLSWIVSIGAQPVDRYEVYVSTATMDAADPSDASLVGKTKKNQFAYEVPNAQATSLLYARVVGILYSGEFVVSNEINSTGTDSLDDMRDGPDRSLAVTILSYVKGGDFSDPAQWNQTTHGGTANVSGGLATLNANGHGAGVFPTIHRAFPGGGVINTRPFPVASTISVALSAKHSGSAPDGDLEVILFSGIEVGDDSETNYVKIMTITAASLTASMQRFVSQFTFISPAPATTAGGNNYKIALRLKGNANVTVSCDKLDVVPGAQPLNAWNFLGHADDIRQDVYPDYTSAGAASGGGNLKGNKYEPIVGALKVYADT